MSQLLMSQQALKLQVSPTLKPQLLPSLRSSFLSSTFTVPTLGVRTEPLGTGLKVGSGSVFRRKVTMAALPGLMPHPDSTLLYVMEFFLAASGPLQMHSEATGKKNMNYSKFAGADGSKQAMVPSRTGMFLCYFPAAVAATVFLAYIVGLLPLASILESVGASGVASFLQHALTASDDRLLLVAAALSIHHVKRCLEVTTSTHCPPSLHLDMLIRTDNHSMWVHIPNTPTINNSSRFPVIPISVTFLISSL